MCWSNHQAARGSWQREMRRRGVVRAEPVRHDDVRVSDAERDDVVEQLSRHTADGRLSLDEFEERVEQALASTTRRDLDVTLRGLPASPPAGRRRIDASAPLRIATRLALVALAVVALGAWVLWIVVAFAWCHLNGRAHRRRRHELRTAEPEADELTLV